MISAREKPTAGIRIGIRTKGCSGLSYTLEYSDAVESTDQVIEVDDVKLRGSNDEQHVPGPLRVRSQQGACDGVQPRGQVHRRRGSGS